MKPDIALSDGELSVVRTILRSHLPAHTKVYAFGSRTNGSAKPWSDLDLIIDAGNAVPLSIMAALAEAFDESDLPWKVDLLDRACVSSEFLRKIDAVKVAVS